MDYMEALARLEYLKGSIATMQEEEKALRQALFAGTFPNPKEGVNNYELPDGTIVKGTYKLNRTIDKDRLAKTKLELPPGVLKAIFKIETKLVDGQYKKLPDEQRAIVDQVLVVKPGLPALEIIRPERMPADDTANLGPYAEQLVQGRPE